MKVLYHHRTSARDGSAVHIEGLIGALRGLGAQVQVVAPPIAKSSITRSRKSRFFSARDRLPRFVHEAAELTYNAAEIMRLSRAIASFRPDVIYQRSNLFLLSGAWTARRAGIPLIEEINAPYFLERSAHGGIAMPWLAARAERAAWRRADAVVAVTGALAEIVAMAGVPRDRLHVMPNGVDSDLFSPQSIDVGAKARLGLERFIVLGFTGFVRDWNGLDVVLEYLTRPEGRGSCLLVVGDGPARPRLEAIARSLQVVDRVRFTGLVGRSQVPSLVSAFDVALQPAANPYASPLKLFEYMALGRAIVAPDQANIREILADERDALLFDRNDLHSFAAAVRRAAADAVLRQRLAAGAVQTIRHRNLTWRHNAERVLALASRLVIAKRNAEGAVVESRTRL